MTVHLGYGMLSAVAWMKYNYVSGDWVRQYDKGTFYPLW